MNDILPRGLCIYDADLGDHFYWEIDFPNETALFWSEGANDQWTAERYTIRRYEDKWQYFEKEEQWKARMASLKEGIEKLGNMSLEILPEEAREFVTSDRVHMEEEYRTCEEGGPNWRTFSAQVSKEIQEGWLKYCNS